MVQRLHEAGVDALKAYQQLSLGQVAAIVNEGARYGLAVVLDSGRMNGCYDLMRHTGIKAWAHLDSLGPMMPHEIDYMVQHDVRQITTLAVIEIYTMRRFRDMSFLECPLIADTVPPHMLEEIRAWVEREFTAPSERRLRSAERLETAMRNALALHRAGVQLVAGTDAPYPGVFQGEGIHHELELLVEAGLTPVEAISCATANAAKLLGKESEWGTVAPGLAADLLVIEGHPDRNIADTRRIGMVIQGGRIIDRAALKHDPKQPDVRAVHCIS
jgi:imidazolonepropionase-like amidohydrolase